MQCAKSHLAAMKSARNASETLETLQKLRFPINDVRVKLPRERRHFNNNFRTQIDMMSRNLQMKIKEIACNEGSCVCLCADNMIMKIK